MPSLVIELDDAAFAALTARAKRRGQSIHQFVEHLAGREARRQPVRAAHPNVTSDAYIAASADRISRQIKLADHVRRYGVPAAHERRALAEILGVTDRTLRRDLKIAEMGLVNGAEIGPIDAGPAPRIGRPPKAASQVG